MKTLRNRVDVRLVANANLLVSRQSLVSKKISNKNLIAVQIKIKD